MGSRLTVTTGLDYITIPYDVGFDLQSAADGGWTLYLRGKLKHGVQYAVRSINLSAPFVRMLFSASGQVWASVTPDGQPNIDIKSPAAPSAPTDDIVYYFRVTPTEFICGFCEKGGVPQETSYAINMNTITNAGGWHVGWQEAGGEAIIGTEYESFGIFSEDISIAQIQSLANGDAATSIGAVVQKYYSMDEGSGTVVNLDGDIGNAATQGTIQGSLAWSTDVVGVDPSITTDPIKNNTGQLLADETGVIADVYDTTNGALVVRKTGLTSDVSGVVTFSDALMSAATEYRVVITLTGNAEGLARITTV